jgi:putative lipoprotein
MSIVLTACSSSGGAGADDEGGEIGVISGVVTYRERIAMPAGAVITVRLLDVTSDEEPTSIAEQRIRPRREVPIPFTLQYDRSRILRGGSYAVAATIEADGQVLWQSTPPQPVRLNVNQANPIEIMVTRR